MTNHIYLKPSVIEKFPDVSYQVLQILFAEEAMMPSRSQKEGGKIKTKPCKLVLNLSGMYFFRPKSVAQKHQDKKNSAENSEYKLGAFVSIHDIVRFVYLDPKKKLVQTMLREIQFECPHSNELVSLALSIRKYLYHGGPEVRPIRLHGFPEPPNLIPIPPVQNLPQVLYSTFCARAFCDQNETLLRLFGTSLPPVKPRITLDQSCTPPSSLLSLYMPVVLLGRIRIVTLKNFSPMSSCRLAHFLIKRSPTVDSIIFEDYFSNQNLVPEQLKLKALTSRKNLFQGKRLSFGLFNCRLSDSTFQKFIKELGEYPFEIQRLSLDGISLSLSSWNYLMHTLLTARSFRTLEIFELNNIDAAELTSEHVTKSLVAIFKHLRFIQTFSCSSWVHPITIDLPFYTNVSLLHHVLFKKQIMPPRFPSQFKFPLFAHLYDFSRCTFTAQCLISLLRQLSTIKTPFTLNLSDLMMPPNDWTEFYNSLPSLPQLRTLRELNWSGNFISSEFLDRFAHYFFDNGGVYYFTFDRVYGSQQLDDLRQLFSIIGQNKLYGLSLCGSQEINFSGNFQGLANVLEFVAPLKILTLDNQYFTDFDTINIYEYLQNNQSLVEVSFESTAISNETSLFDFYDNIFSCENIITLKRPNTDISRILGPTLNNIGSPERWARFMNKMRDKLIPLPETLRSYFFNMYFKQTWETQQYASFIQLTPSAFFTLPDSDPFILGHFQKKGRLPSLTALRHPGPNSLAQLHSTLLLEPKRLPRYRAATEFVLPEWLMNTRIQLNRLNEEDFLESGYGSQQFLLSQYTASDFQQRDISNEDFNQSYLQDGQPFVMSQSQDNLQENAEYWQQDPNYQYYQQDPNNQYYPQDPNNQDPNYQYYPQDPNNQDPNYQYYPQDPNNQDPNYQYYPQDPNNQDPNYQYYPQDPNNQDPNYQYYPQDPNNQDPNYQYYPQDPNNQDPNYQYYPQDPNNQDPNYQYYPQDPNYQYYPQDGQYDQQNGEYTQDPNYNNFSTNDPNYESQMPMMPELDESNLPPPQQENTEITNVKPLLTSTLKERDESEEPQSPDALPTMIDLPEQPDEDNQLQYTYIPPPPQEQPPQLQVEEQEQTPEPEPQPEPEEPKEVEQIVVVAPETKTQPKEQPILPAPRPAAKKPKKTRTVNFPSAAGPLNHPVVPSGTSTPSFPMMPFSIKLMDHDDVQVPELSKSKDTIDTSEKKCIPPVDFDELTAGSTETSFKLPEANLAALSNQSKLDTFYSYGCPFSVTPANKEGVVISPMSHPLESRTKLIPPKVSILGIPSEW